MRVTIIFSTERMPNGFIVIHGIIGTRRYLYYSEREAKSRYRAEAKQHRMKCGGVIYYTR